MSSLLRISRLPRRLQNPPSGILSALRSRSVNGSSSMMLMQQRSMSSNMNDEEFRKSLFGAMSDAETTEEEERKRSAQEASEDDPEFSDPEWLSNLRKTLREDTEAVFGEDIADGRTLHEGEDFEHEVTPYDSPGEYFESLGLDINNPPQLRDEHYSLFLHGVRDPSLGGSGSSASSTTSIPEAEDVESLTQDIRRMINELQRDEQELTEQDIEFLESVNWVNTAGWDSFREQGIPIDPDEFQDLASLDFDFPDPAQQRRPRPKTKCLFCRPDPSRSHLTELVYYNVNLLHRFVNQRGMITAPRWNHCCAKHQRRLAKCIKQARYIGLMDFQSNWKVPLEFLKYRESEPDLRKHIIEKNRSNPIRFTDAIGDNAVAFQIRSEETEQRDH